MTDMKPLKESREKRVTEPEVVFTPDDFQSKRILPPLSDVDNFRGDNRNALREIRDDIRSLEETLSALCDVALLVADENHPEAVPYGDRTQTFLTEARRKIQDIDNWVESSFPRPPEDSQVYKEFFGKDSRNVK